MNNIKLLDCTLRDGGHLNESKYGKDIIIKYFKNIIKSNVDIIELGFLTDQKYDSDYTLFHKVSDVRHIIDTTDKQTEYSLMAYKYDVSDLEDCDGTVDLIRTTFHKYDFDEGIANCKKVIDKGYKCSVNFINFLGAYSEIEKIKALEAINEIKPHAVSIADTYGLMDLKDMRYVCYLVENTLDKDVSFGIHVHENKGISYALAQIFLEAKVANRAAIIDASVYGMGEVPGNLKMELIMDYLNKNYSNKYNLNYIYYLIDEIFEKLLQKYGWDYSLPYAIASKHGGNRRYAEYLKKHKVSLCNMDSLIPKIKGMDKFSYNKNLINKLINEIDNGDVEK